MTDVKKKKIKDDEFKEPQPMKEQIVNSIPTGWNPMESAPQDGSNIRVSETGGDEGIMVYWKRTRCRENGQWKPRGRWTDTLSHQAISIKPCYWREDDTVYYVDNISSDKAKIADLERRLAQVTGERRV